MFPRVAHRSLDMLRVVQSAMVHFTNMRRGRRRWCTAVVLVAVCALTVSVATRYSYSLKPVDEAVKSVQKYSSWNPGLQRLLNNASTWMPPIADTEIMQDPGYYPDIPQSRPAISNVLLEKNLYNRPPPAFLPLA